MDDHANEHRLPRDVAFGDPAPAGRLPPRDALPGHPRLAARAAGWTTPYLLTVDEAPAGYGAVAHAGPWKDKPTIFEFFVLPTQRHRTFRLFSACRGVRDARVETQTNDPFLGPLIQTFCPSVAAEAILYEDKVTTSIRIPGAASGP